MNYQLITGMLKELTSSSEIIVFNGNGKILDYLGNRGLNELPGLTENKFLTIDTVDLNHITEHYNKRNKSITETNALAVQIGGIEFNVFQAQEKETGQDDIFIAVSTTSDEPDLDYGLLIDNIDYGIGVYSPVGKLLFFNKKALSYLDSQIENYSGMFINEIFGDILGQQYLERIKQVSTTRKILEFEEEVELNNLKYSFISVYSPLVNKNHELIAVQISSREITKQKKAEEEARHNYNAMLNIMEDLAEEIQTRRQTELYLRDSREILQKSQEIGDIGSFVWDTKLRELSFSANLVKILKIEKKDKENSLSLLKNFIHVEDRKHVLDELRKMLIKRSSWPIEFRSARNNNIENHFQFISEFLINDSGNILKIIGVIRDITIFKQYSLELKKSYEQIRTYALHLQNIREDERKNLARELHDEMGHTLSAFNMNLSYFEREFLLKDKTIDRDEILNEIAQMRNAIKNSVLKLKKIITELRPEVLEALPIDAAVKWLMDQFREKGGFAIIYKSDFDEFYWDKDKSLALFRVIQESITNIVKYAEATEVYIEFNKTSDTVNLRISDNGIGFDMENIVARKSFGILGLKERIINIGGTYSINSTIGKGTIVEVFVPV